MQNVSILPVNLAGSQGSRAGGSKVAGSQGSFDSYLKTGDTSSAGNSKMESSPKATEQVKESQDTPDTKADPGKEELVKVPEGTGKDAQISGQDTVSTENSGQTAQSADSGQLSKQIGDLIRDAVTEELDLDQETFDGILAAMGITPIQLTDPEILKQFVMQLNGTAEVTDFLTNEPMLDQLNQLMEGLDSIDWEGLTGYTLDQLKTMIAENAVSQDQPEVILAETAEETAAWEQQTQPQQESSVETGNSPLQAERAVVEMNRQEGTAAVQKEEARTETLAQKQISVAGQEKGQAEKNFTFAQSDGKEPQENTSSEDRSLGGLLWKDSQSQPIAPNMEGVSFENLMQMEKAVETPVQTHIQQMVDIVNQVVDRIRTVVKEDVTTMEMQLNPEHLGKVSLTISSRDGVMTASFLVQTHEAREALESQMFQLRENLEQKNLKVDAVEVSVSDFSFEQSDFQQPGDNKDFGQGDGKARKYDFEGESEEDVEAAEEQLRQNVMQDLGSSVDFIA